MKSRLAVAIMAKKRPKFIEKNLPENMRQNYVLEVDCHWVEALDVLCKQQLLSDVSVKMYYK